MNYNEKILIANNKLKFKSILESSLLPKSNQVLINILTRTSNRPFYFAECRNSIVNQSYRNIRHIVSVDDDYTYNYVKENGLLNQDILQLERPTRINASHMPYNLYMNSLIKEVKEGWIMFLDDDDILHDINSISTLVNNLPNIPSTMIFKTKVGDVNLPKLYFRKKIVRGDITSNCFIFHSLYKDNSHWIDQKGSDFYFLHLLSQSVKVFWLNQVITKVNNQNIMGRGFRQDKVLTTLRLKKLLIDNNFLDKLDYYLHYNKKVKHHIFKKDYLNNYFDHIYVLSLERRLDKFCKTVNRLQNNDIFNFERFFGIDGNLREIRNKYYNYLNQKSKTQYTNNNFIPSSGSFAILLSMKNMLIDAIKNDYKKILVLQDDIVLIQNFKVLLSSYEKLLNSDWKLIYLGASQHNWKNIQFNLEKQIYYCLKTDGAFAVGINNNIFQLLIEFINHATLPFDSGPLTDIQKMYPQDCFVLFPNLIIADVSDSDCRRNRDQNIMSNKFRWGNKYDFYFYNKNNFIEPLS